MVFQVDYLYFFDILIEMVHSVLPVGSKKSYCMGYGCCLLLGRLCVTVHRHPVWTNLWLHCTHYSGPTLPMLLSFLSLLFPWLEDPCLRPLPSLLSLASSDSHLSVSYLSTLNRSCGSQNSETKPVPCATKSWTSRGRTESKGRTPSTFTIWTSKRQQDIIHT